MITAARHAPPRRPKGCAARQAPPFQTQASRCLAHSVPGQGPRMSPLHRSVHCTPQPRDRRPPAVRTPIQAHSMRCWVRWALGRHLCPPGCAGRMRSSGALMRCRSVIAHIPRGSDAACCRRRRTPAGAASPGRSSHEARHQPVTEHRSARHTTRECPPGRTLAGLMPRRAPRRQTRPMRPPQPLAARSTLAKRSSCMVPMHNDSSHSAQVPMVSTPASRRRSRPRRPSARGPPTGAPTPERPR